MTTAYFSFGQVHIHTINGKTLDRNCLAKITSECPRQSAFQWFGRHWSHEYSEEDLPDIIEYYPRGVVEL